MESGLRHENSSQKLVGLQTLQPTKLKICTYSYIKAFSVREEAVQNRGWQSCVDSTTGGSGHCCQFQAGHALCVLRI